uniref:Uncharacterized protein n=1 Tax=Anguilla anguilla TaxID=7936 RepID=A0A0E9PWM4_ANGAN
MCLLVRAHTEHYTCFDPRGFGFFCFIVMDMSFIPDFIFRELYVL